MALKFVSNKCPKNCKMLRHTHYFSYTPFPSSTSTEFYPKQGDTSFYVITDARNGSSNVKKSNVYVSRFFREMTTHKREGISFFFHKRKIQRCDARVILLPVFPSPLQLLKTSSSGCFSQLPETRKKASSIAAEMVWILKFFSVCWADGQLFFRPQRQTITTENNDVCGTNKYLKKLLFYDFQSNFVKKSSFGTFEFEWQSPFLEVCPLFELFLWYQKFCVSPEGSSCPFSPWIIWLKIIVY